MSKLDIIRAWKDAKYRRGLSDAERAALPEHPSGLIELSDEDLKSASGLGGGGDIQTTAITCTQYTWNNWQACGCRPIMTTAITCTEWSAKGWDGCCP
ncbi:MAG: mersacidin/lichenicidin family type 2 lantibiotic [Acidobacteria bacterium]|nr:mersacidin/lichenicidin family type 2 lantibiotic [Acidobacteriota bacterium]